MFTEKNFESLNSLQLDENKSSSLRSDKRLDYLLYQLRDHKNGHISLLNPELRAQYDFVDMGVPLKAYKQQGSFFKPEPKHKDVKEPMPSEQAVLR